MSIEPTSAVFHTRYGADGASSRTRAFEYLEPLAKLGIQAVAVSRVDEQGAPRARALEEVCELACGGAVVVLQKPSLTFNELEALVSASRGRLVVDFDDAIWMGYGPADPADGLASLEATLRNARLVTAGSTRLAAWARRVSGRPVKVLPPSLDLRRYPRVRRHECLTRPVVAWVGTSGNHADLTVARSALCALAADRIIRLRVISDRPLNPGDWPSAEWMPWSLATEASTLAQCDVGIMPLLDDERTRGRCGYKAVQYQAAGLPVVASPVPGPTDALGGTPLFARTEAEWREALTTLAGAPELRRARGEAGRAYVEARRSIQRNAVKLAAMLRSV